MVASYKDIVISNFPCLAFLDGTEVQKSDRILAENFIEKANQADLVLRCSKLIGLEKPPKMPKTNVFFIINLYCF